MSQSNSNIYDMRIHLHKFDAASVGQNIDFNALETLEINLINNIQSSRNKNQKKTMSAQNKRSTMTLYVSPNDLFCHKIK